MTKVLKIFDGVTVRCNLCGEEHIISGMTGNNLEWRDADGWIGSYDAAHGYFESTDSDSLCPECQDGGED